MFLCRTGRLSAATLDQAFKSAGSLLVQVKANRLRDVTLTLRKEHTFQGHRCFCVSVGQTRAHLRKQQADLDCSSGLVITDWAHLDRVAAVAVNLSKSAQSQAGNSDLIRQPLVHRNSRGGPGGHVLLTGTGGVSSRRCSTTRTMHTRAAATKKSTDAGEEQTADGNKGEEQSSKEASTASSSTVKAQEEPEPEGGKPSKTQQLKKVFKEYGAVGVSFHICISLMSLGMFYLLISSGIDMAAVLCKLGFSETVVRSKMAAGTSTFVLAYAIHKLFAPVRISITLVSVPLIVRYFRKTGLFKPPTPAP
ncbi:protein FAM210B, mitochondrial [Pagrus major]|uniref:protein FAM210B, mitochondrial n=1 Tax=Pagrus major TaxID=143350 RepID=UPI003CC8A704